MRFARLLAVTAMTVLAFAPQASPAQAASGPGQPACSSTSYPALNTDSTQRTATLGSDVVEVPGATEVSILCQLQAYPIYDVNMPPSTIRLSRICVGINVCNGKGGWLCVGVNVCNGYKPSNDICVGVNVCNRYSYMATDMYTFSAFAGEPLFLCSVVSWRDANGVEWSRAYDASEQQPGAQCALAHVA